MQTSNNSRYKIYVDNDVISFILAGPSVTDASILDRQKMLHALSEMNLEEVKLYCDRDSKRKDIYITPNDMFISKYNSLFDEEITNEDIIASPIGSLPSFDNFSEELSNMVHVNGLSYSINTVIPNHWGNLYVAFMNVKVHNVNMVDLELKTGNNIEAFPYSERWDDMKNYLLCHLIANAMEKKLIGEEIDICTNEQAA